jgi:peptidyl-tRNA hydrolase
MSDSSKMYICVRDDVPDFMVPTLVGHAVLRHHLWNSRLGDIPLYENWLMNSFKKCVVRMNSKEFGKAMSLENCSHAWENSTLNGETSCVTVVVDKDVPNVLKFAKLWSPKND